MRKVWISLALALAALAGPATVALGQDDAAPPGEGVVCATAIYNFMVEVGTRCGVSKSIEGLALLKETAARYDRYVLENGWTPEQLAAFKTKQSHVGVGGMTICTDETIKWYQATEDGFATKPEEMKAEVDKSLARPGEPTWGTCL